MALVRAQRSVASALAALAFVCAVDQQLPPISYVCPMPQDADVVEEKPGKCPKCGMVLVPVRLDTRWSCPMHPMVLEKQPGTCPIDQRDLVEVTVSVYFSCAARPEVHEINPGKCPDGTDRVMSYERRPHGDHNPRHGGQFFMASDNRHHLEGTYPSAGVFRVFMYDDYTKPIQVKGISGRAVTREEFDGASRATRELQVFDLKPSKRGTSLEARIEPSEFPVQITAKLKFGAKAPEQRFDFTFPEYTKEPQGARAITTSASGALPATSKGLLDYLNTRDRQIQTLLNQGALTQLWVPALESKDAALALERQVAELPEDRRAQASRAVKTLLVAAWRIDRYGDLGNKPMLTETYTVFSGAVAELNATYGSTNR
jgi:hypothetical protein